MNPFVADPAWGWWIILYFYLGGIAAGAYFLATLVELFGRAEDRVVARSGFRIAFPLTCACGILLIVDLERPERFWHMLLQSEVVEQAFAEGWPTGGGWGTMLGAPMIKWWSPMSIGAWAIFLFGGFSFLSLLGTFRTSEDKRGWVRRGVAGLFHVTGSALGFFVAAYTGVLLAATNQPVWSDTTWIGPLFLTSSASTGIAAVLLVPAWS